MDKEVARLLDANLNRAREGLRVVEDTARFVWNDKAQYKRLRALRHQLHRLTKKHYKAFVTARASAADAGRFIPEGRRDRVSDVVASNMRRAQEALRVLEEYSKVFSRQAASMFKEIRYRLYVEETRVMKRL